MAKRRIISTASIFLLIVAVCVPAVSRCFFDCARSLGSPVPAREKTASVEHACCHPAAQEQSGLAANHECRCASELLPVFEQKEGMELRQDSASQPLELVESPLSHALLINDPFIVFSPADLSPPLHSLPATILRI